MANSYWVRQEDPPESSSLSASDTASPTSAAPEASESVTDAASVTDTASTTDTAPPATATDADATPAAGNETTSDTATATSSSPAATSTSPFLPTTPEELRCHRDRQGQPAKNVANPFCDPEPGQQLLVNETYNVTWDPTLFDPNSTNKVSFKYTNDTDASDTWQQEGLRNERGYVPLKIYPSYLENRPNNTNVTLFLASGDDQVLIGPIFSIIAPPSNSTSDKGSGSKDLGEKAGIPVGLGLFLIAVAGFVFWFLRRRRNKAAGYMAKRSTRVTGDSEGGGAGGFRDEPTRGLELQDRAGHGRQDSWEAGWDSTTSSQAGGGGGGNAFRDEIDRQRRR
ncbi:MAG: hypothetical protein LQ345_002127 [Seirophora villosa]|nr:MAG: hypothetical protein LQ345_002127 [Seirophora villosa]